MTDFLAKASQNTAELSWLTNLVHENEVKSYLEIGSYYGGSLWRIANAMPQSSRVVFVDLPLLNGGERASLRKCAEALQVRGYEVHAMFADSKSENVIHWVSKLAPFDFCLIDGDHSLAGVSADWANYGLMAKMVAFHDIAWSRPPEWDGTRIEVPEFWNSIKDEFRHEECKLHHSKSHGIGVLWQ